LPEKIQNPPSNFSHEDTQRYTKKKRASRPSPMKNFWESGTLFTKRVLAAGGKVAVDFGYQGVEINSIFL
jgi:hypothetical protein